MKNSFEPVIRLSQEKGITTMEIIESAILTELDPDLYPYVDEYHVHRDCRGGKVPNFVARYVEKHKHDTQQPDLPIIGLA